MGNDPKNPDFFDANNKTYMIVPASNDNGINIIDVSNPSSPSQVSFLEDGSTYTYLDSPRDVKITTIGGSTYALVASNDDVGMQIINVTDPENPSSVSVVTNAQFQAVGQPQTSNQATGHDIEVVMMVKPMHYLALLQRIQSDG